MRVAAISNAVFYIFTFLTLYIQVFFIVTFFEKRKEILIRTKPVILPEYPTVTIIVPCYNEEQTVGKTVESLLALEYPKDKLSIILVDDGSKDGTWEVLQKFTSYPNIKAFTKKNGGKHTALNFGLEHVTTEFVGGLDADSFVHPEALVRIISYFADKKTMAVSSAVVVHEPKNIVQKAQKAEYHFGVFMKKMLGTIGGIHVAPGPFTIFRKKVFDDLGPYRKAHNTEDAEIALRMQKNHYKIEHCPDGYVYTVSPATVPKLYRQRVRWIYGFIRNATDYRDLFFNTKYGNIGWFTLPAGFISIITIVFVFLSAVYRLVLFASESLVHIKAVGFSSFFHFKLSSFDWFFLNTETVTILALLLTAMLLVTLLIGQRMVEGKIRFSMDIVYFFLLSNFIAPFWLGKALLNAAFGKEGSWVEERAAGTQL